MLGGKTAKGPKTEARIRRALLTLMAKKSLDAISVAEVCREADVTRGTFYLHYNTVADVYDQLMLQLVSESLPMESQATCCEGCPQEGKAPFCHIVRHSGEFEPMVGEDRFLLSFLEGTKRPTEDSLERELIDWGYDMQQARAIKAFQTGGCFAASTKVWISDRDWPKVQQTIDCYVRGGLDALKNRS